jgi:hypothetical protein
MTPQDIDSAYREYMVLFQPFKHEQRTELHLKSWLHGAYNFHRNRFPNCHPGLGMILHFMARDDGHVPGDVHPGQGRRVSGLKAAAQYATWSLPHTLAIEDTYRLVFPSSLS